MSASGTIIVLFYQPGMGEFIDPEFDVAIDYPAGALTWRREGQVIPTAMRPVFSFDAEDVKQDHSVAFVERLVDFSKGLMTRRQAIDISTKFHRDIRMAMPQGIGWGYFHSHRWSERIKRIEQENQRIERGELADWERELLESGSSV